MPLAGSPVTHRRFDIVIRCMKVGIDGNRRAGGWPMITTDSRQSLHIRNAVGIDACVVDVERFEDLEHVFHIQLLGDRPLNDVQVFLFSSEAFENGIEQVGGMELAID